MAEFWESVYKNNAKMWGEKPTDNAFRALHVFKKHALNTILVPGFGYGRNAKVFFDQGMKVTGIEISETAIARAHTYFGNEVTIHHGSVTEMPYDKNLYDCIYCYSLIHLLNAKERQQLIAACYQQLNPGGLMIFSALSINDTRYGIGKKVDTNTYFSPNGLQLYFYNEEAIKHEFGAYTIKELKEINEPEENPNEKLWQVICHKKQ